MNRFDYILWQKTLRFSFLLEAAYSHVWKARWPRGGVTSGPGGRTNLGKVLAHFLTSQRDGSFTITHFSTCTLNSGGERRVTPSLGIHPQAFNMDFL